MSTAKWRNEWIKNNTQMIGVRYKKDASEYKALQEAVKETGTKQVEYIKSAVRERLIREGYLSEKMEE